MTTNDNFETFDIHKKPYRSKRKKILAIKKSLRNNC